MRQPDYFGPPLSECDATELRTCFVIRPKGALGTCGFHPCGWSAFSVTKAQFYRSYTKTVPIRKD